MNGKLMRTLTLMGTVVLSLLALLSGTWGEALAAGSTKATTHPASLHGGHQTQLSSGYGTLTYAQTGGTAMVTGTVSYRQRIALTPEAVITVTLVDQSRADAPAE